MQICQRQLVRTVYLCDDGKDVEKEKLVGELNRQCGDCVVYVAREKRRDGECPLARGWGVGWGWRLEEGGGLSETKQKLLLLGGIVLFNIAACCRS